MKWIITGGAGFIGSQFVRCAVQQKWAEEVVVIDSLTYAGNLQNLDSVLHSPGFEFCKIDITDKHAVQKVFAEGADAVFHFAAESHVDRSIESASEFVSTNVLGTQILLDAARAYGIKRFVHVSTDEVYGSLELNTPERFTEQHSIVPSSPYAASKAASDHLVLAAYHTHQQDVVITRCSNNYGPFQFPEKFIPLFITNAMMHQTLPLYGDGLNVRDWIHVDDHAQGVKLAFEKGISGEVYNFGGDCERSNKDIAKVIIELTGASETLIKRVADRKGHDRRYAMDASKAKRELGFVPGPSIEQRLPELVTWYKENKNWWEQIKAGAYRHYYDRLYKERLAAS